MARINTKGQLSGAVGPVFFRMLNGKGILQSMPRKYTQAAASKANGSEFGLASSTAKKIRSALANTLLDRADSGMYRRFTGVVHAAIKGNHELLKGSRSLAEGNLELLRGFEFNTGSQFADYCAIMPHAVAEDDMITITMPAADGGFITRMPNLASECEISLHVTVVDLEGEGQPIDWQQFGMPLPVGTPQTQAAEWVITPLAAGKLAIVTASLHFFHRDKIAGKTLLNSKLLHPCAVVGVFRT